MKGGRVSQTIHPLPGTRDGAIVEACREALAQARRGASDEVLREILRRGQIRAQINDSVGP